MFSRAITGSAKFLRLPATARLLYYDLGMNADDDGAAEAYSVIKLTGAAESDLTALVDAGLITMLNSDQVIYINDWKRNNQLRGDRYRQGIYAYLIEQARNGEIQMQSSIEN